MIYVTLGTMYLGFDRLALAMDAIAQETGEVVIMQTGLSPLRPPHCRCFDFKPREDLLALQREARVVVTHAGIGSVMDALACARPLLVVPRLRRYGEHNNDHQMDLASMVAERGWGRMILDMAELAGACAAPPPAPVDYRPDRDRLIANVRAFVLNAAGQGPADD